MRFLDTSLPARSSVCVLVTALLLFTIPTAVLGEVVFSAPVAGAEFSPLTSITVAWTDDGNEPVTTPTTGTYTLDLCSGSNAKITVIASGLGTGVFAAGAQRTSIIIQPGYGGDGPYYFLRITWTTATGGIVRNYSDRFEMQGMAAEFSPDVAAQNLLGDTDRPPAEHPQEAVVIPDGAQGEFAVPYTEQTGPVRYAPMQPRPGSVITAKNMKRLHPTSAYTIFTTKGPAPRAQTTITQDRTYALTTVVNDASPAPMPDDDMAKFLNRWKD
ncbi:hypothetical protein ABW19_dt0204234 [Dactylella cylindrospora]|nr:hypothetical protein ABW19_dt0204234 [Dactylella cylindrospora]